MNKGRLELANVRLELANVRLELANVRLELGNSDASLRIRYAAFTALETERDHYREADKDKAEENIQLKDQIRKLNEEAKTTLAKEVQSLNGMSCSLPLCAFDSGRPMVLVDDSH